MKPIVFSYEPPAPQHAIARRVGTLLAALAVCAMLGCKPTVQTASNQQAQQDRLRQADREAALLKAATKQLADLPAAVDTELRPPVVVLDSRKTATTGDVFAVCVGNPAILNAPINIVFVPAGNGRFRGLGARPGDVLRYYVREDPTVDEDSRMMGLSRMLPVDLKIAEVFDDNTLILEQPQFQPTLLPAKVEVFRNVDTRLADINEKLVLYDTRRLPPVGWEPAPDETVLNQVLAWLNQWIRQTTAPAGWKPDPLLDTLPAELRNDPLLKPFISAEALAARVFLPHEARRMQEVAWLRDIAQWATGNAVDEVGRATALFDWVVRNIQLEPEDQAAPHRPWQSLVYGRGTAAERVWVFASLARLQGLDVVAVEIPSASSAEASAAGTKPSKWLAAIVSNGQLYLFDPTLGLPIAGPKGEGVATLEQIARDNSLLRALDLPDNPYPATAELAKQASAFVVADAFDLSMRASMLEANLPAEDHVPLAVAASELASRVKSANGVTSVGLWELPFRTLRDQLLLGNVQRHREAIAFEPFAVRPFLWKARTRHFQGRPADRQAVGDEPESDHQEALDLYMHRSVRPKDSDIAKITSPDRRRVDSTAKLHATYWLGLLSFDEGKPAVAANWLSRPELAAKGSPWLHGARYNLARALEAEGKLDEAIAILEKDESPQRHGNQLRAAQLKSRRPAEKTKGNP
ncbi:MAG: hypothetical protein IT425_04895 [Pirellulales bacterium]|nr:hypothetical protein [Pirellulales bacterium]